MNKTMRPRRSVLYVPAANAKAMPKAETLACDAIIFDLEDAVAPSAKPLARVQLEEHFARYPSSVRERVIRINGSSTEWWEEDLKAAIGCRPDALLLPKAETAEQIIGLRGLMHAAGGGSIPIWAMCETPLALVNIREITMLGAEEKIGLACLIAGTNDLAKETGLDPVKGRQTMLTWLSQAVIHAKAFGIDIIDGVYNDFRDLDGLAVECRDAADRGFDGKTLIHPSQIDEANKAFAPSDAEIEYARIIVDAFETPENHDKGVISINGKMVERLHAELAKRLLMKAEK